MPQRHRSVSTCMDIPGTWHGIPTRADWRKDRRHQVHRVPQLQQTSQDHIFINIYRSEKHRHLHITTRNVSDSWLVNTVNRCRMTRQNILKTSLFRRLTALVLTIQSLNDTSIGNWHIPAVSGCIGTHLILPLYSHAILASCDLLVSAVKRCFLNCGDSCCLWSQSMCLWLTHDRQESERKRVHTRQSLHC